MVTQSRIVVAFDTAGFLRALPVTGAAARVKGLYGRLHDPDRSSVRLLLCDLSPDSAPTVDWPMPVEYVDYATMYENPGVLADRVRAAAADLLVMSNTELLVRQGRTVADAVGAALVYEMHDNEPMVLASIGAGYQAVIDARELQGAAIARADAVVVFTARDADAARAWGARSVHIIPCGVDLGPRPDTADRPGGAVAFAGNLHYEPNRRAVLWLHRELAPALGAEHARIDVYGRYPARLARELGASSIRLHGPVPDLRAALGSASIGVAPLDSGGGMKLKLLEYMAAGLAIVGTPESLTGLDRPGDWALISTPGMADLPGLVRDVIRDDARRRDLADRARAAAAAYAWTRIAHRARAVFAGISRGSGPVPGITPRVAELAARPPYWLAEWRGHGEDAAPQGELTVQDYAAHGGRGIIAELAPAIDCARVAAAAATGSDWPAGSALVGYGERSVLFFAPATPAGPGPVLKVYGHRASERLGRELAGLRLAAQCAGLRVPQVLASADAPGAQAWLAMTRLAGHSPDQLAEAQVTGIIARVAARLHTIPTADLAHLDPYTVHLRDEPAPDPTVEALRARLAAAHAPLDGPQRRRCVPGFVHGDLAAGNILLADAQDPGVIDFERTGRGCVYEDLTRMWAASFGRQGTLLSETYMAERAALGHPFTLDTDHLMWHLARHLRWVLQWAPAIDPDLTAGVRALAPNVADTLAS